MDILYSFLKITSLIATGIFAALGLLTKYKNDAGKITRWGKVALAGILISSSVSLGLFVLETSRAKAAAQRAKADAEATKASLEEIINKAKTTASLQEESLQKTDKLQRDMQTNLDRQQQNLEGTDKISKDMRSSIAAQRILLANNQQILSGLTESITQQLGLLNQTREISVNVNRSLFPIEPFTASFTFAIPATHPVVQNYAAYLKVQAKRLLPQFREERRTTKPEEGLSYIEGLFVDETQNSIDIAAGSKHIPSYETPEGKLLNRQVFIVQFFKPPFDLGAIRTGAYVKPDLEMWATAFADSPNNNSNTLDFMLVNGRLLQRAWHVRPSSLKQTGNITTLLDFEGALLVLKFVGGLDKSFQIGGLTLNQPKGMCLRFNAKLFQRSDERRLRPGEIVIEAGRLPDTILFQILPPNFRPTADCDVLFEP